MTDLRDLLEKATERPWHFDLDRKPPYNFAALITADDARLAESLVNAALFLLDVYEKADYFTDESHEATADDYRALRDAVDRLDAHLSKP